MKFRTWSRVVIGAVVLVCVAVAAYEATAPSAAMPNWEGNAEALNGHKAPNFTLRDQNGKPVSLRRERGQAVILTFFYTHCPDTCPLTSQKLRTILHSFGKERRKVSVLIVSTDPLRDNPADAKAFLKRNGSSSWHFLLGNFNQLKRVWKEYAIYAASPSLERKVGPQHSAYIYLIDAQGREQALLDDTEPAPDIAQDLHILLRDHEWLRHLPAGPKVGDRTPQLVLPSLQKGQKLSPADFRGSPLLINFWATTCVPCLREMPLLERTYRHYHGRLKILGIDDQEPANEVRAYVKQVHVSYPIALDSEGSSWYTYQLAGTPTTFFVNRRGIIRFINRGQLNSLPSAALSREIAGIFHIP